MKPRKSYGQRLCALALKLDKMSMEPNKTIARRRFILRSIARFNRAVFTGNAAPGERSVSNGSQRSNASFSTPIGNVRVL